jgi:hypothetical protein
LNAVAPAVTTSDVTAIVSPIIGALGLAFAVILAFTARSERRRREALEERVRRADYNPVITKSLRLSGYAQPRPDAVTVTLTNAHTLALNVSAGIRYDGWEVESKTRRATLT